MNKQMCVCVCVVLQRDLKFFPSLFPCIPTKSGSHTQQQASPRRNRLPQRGQPGRAIPWGCHVQCDASDEEIPRHGTALGRGEDGRCACSLVRDPQVCVKFTTYAVCLFLYNALPTKSLITLDHTPWHSVGTPTLNGPLKATTNALHHPYQYRASVYISLFFHGLVQQCGRVVNSLARVRQSLTK